MSKDKLLQTLVVKQLDRQSNSGELESVQSIFSKVPKPRLLKEAQTLVFDQVKHSVENSLAKEEFRRLKKIDESKHIRALNLKLGKSMSEATIKNEQTVLHEKLKSGNAIQKSLRFLKNQNSLNLDMWLGNPQNSYSQVQYIKIPETYDTISTRLFLGDSEIRKLFPCFQSDYEIQFRNSILPNRFQLEKRAEVLAKLFLQEVYEMQVPVLEQQERNQREELLKNIELEKVKAQIQEQTMKEEKDMVEEQFHDNDLMRQVIKIEGLLEKKMNTLAYQLFCNKDFDASVRVKKSLQKMKRTVRETPQTADKLKYLIRFKQERKY